jgi:hypothetical protein
MPRLRQAGAKLPPTLAFSLRHPVSYSPLSFHIWNIITILHSRGHVFLIDRTRSPEKRSGGLVDAVFDFDLKLSNPVMQ